MAHAPRTATRRTERRDPPRSYRSHAATAPGHGLSRLARRPSIPEDGVVEISDAVAVAGQLPTAELLIAAQREVLECGPDDPVPHPVALHLRPTREVFAAAQRLLSSDDAAARELGVLILRELGPQDEAGQRPFSTEAVPLLLGRLARESDPGVLGWVISALGYNGATEALGEVVGFTSHPDWRVRFHVAAALPLLVNPDQVEPSAAEALMHLCQDDEAETRYYALYALLDEVVGVDPEQLTQTLTGLLNDPDEQIRSMALTRRVDA